MKPSEKNVDLRTKIDSSIVPRLKKDICLIESQDSFGSGQEIKIGIAQNLEAKDLTYLAAKNGLRHIVQTSKNKFQREIRLASELVSTPNNFLMRPDAFVLQNEKPDNRLSIPFRHSKNRDEALSHLLQFLKKIPGGEMVRDSVRILSDELITNALYNAPTDPLGKHQNAHFPRTKSVELSLNQTAIISLAFDEERLFLSCEDPFGSLGEEKFISGLNSKYGNDELASVNMGPGGAGLGCRMLFDRSSELIIVCQSGVKTFFGCSILLGLSARELEKTDKNLHLAFFK